MIDFWINVILTLAVTFALILVDWIANQLIVSKRRITETERRIDELIAQNATKAQIKDEISRILSSPYSSLLWGNDLASIAFSLDLAVLGVWIVNPALFPFFSKWNTPNASREIPVWLIVIFIHFILLMSSIFLKHYHIGKKESIPVDELYTFPNGKWIAQNLYILSSNVVGFISLLSAFAIITNSWPWP